MSGRGRNSSARLVPLLLATLLPAAAPAQAPAAAVLRSVTVSGAPGEREVRTLLRSSPGTPADSLRAARDAADILALYRGRGFYDAAVTPVLTPAAGDSLRWDLDFHIITGEPTLLCRFDVAGLAAVPSAEFRSRAATREGAPLDEAALATDMDALLDRLELEGYPFAACSVVAAARRPEDPLCLDLLLGVDEGPRVTIREISVEGNVETDPAVVVRETRLGTGEVYTPSRVAAIRSRLQRLGIFESVEEPELYLRNGTGGLRIRVREGSTNTFDGVIGYLPPRVPGEGGTVTGLASVAMRNLFGSGRRFSLRWARDDQFSQELGLRYLEPWVLGVPLNVGGGFFQRKQDTAYVRRVVDLAAELMFTERLSVAGTVTMESVIPSDSGAARVLRSSALSIGAWVAFDARDDAYSPRSGVRYRADYSNGRQRTDRGADALQRFGMDFESYVEMFPRQVLVLGLHGRDVSGGSVGEGEMVRLGGLRTLRGFRENQFLGTRLAWTALEYRLLLERRSFLGAFLDTGYIFRPAGPVPGMEGTDLFTFGYGAALQVETGLGILAVSLALGRGDPVGDAKVHFGLVNEF